MSSERLRAIVVDDEPPARDELVFLLGECGDVEVVGQAANAAQAMALCETAEADVAFVDLRMPGPDGLALAEALLARDPRMSVVVVSAHDDGAIRAFEARVLDYLLKPVRLERLRQTLERVRKGRRRSEPPSGMRGPPSRLPREDPARGEDASLPRRSFPAPSSLTRLAVRRKGTFVVVDLADVVWFEMRDELVWAVTETDRYALDLTLAAVEQRVPAGEFFRSHRSALVRIARIQAMEPSGAGTFDLVLDHPDHPRVPLARERARVLREIIPVAG